MRIDRFRGMRWVGLGVATLLAAGAWLIAPSGPWAVADDCPDAEVIFARGTSEPPGVGRVGEAFIEALRAQAPAEDIGVYAVNYKASRLQLHGGDGANDVIGHVKDMADKCPATKLVLGGYSQGATVIDIVAGVPVGGISWGSPLSAEYADQVAAVAVFGNAANRMGGSLTSTSALLGAKAIDLCNAADPICHEGEGNQWEGHTDGYIPVMTSQAASFAASRIQTGRPHLQPPARHLN